MWDDSRKGPSVPTLVKPKRLTLKSTPVPLAFDVAETYPRMVVVFLFGRVAVYVTPAGLLVVMSALPSFPVVPGPTVPGA